MNSVIFNIPIRLIDLYRGRNLVVRANNASEFAQRLLPDDIENLQYVQLTDLQTPTDALTSWADELPIDLLMDEPAAQFTELYNFSALQHKHPVRVTIPATAGFAKAVKAALALKFSVKIDISQPDGESMVELGEVRDIFLHRSTVTQSVEPFHSIFLSFFHREPASVWRVQEEDPDQFCYVNDEGVEVRSRRIAGGLAYQQLTGSARAAGRTNECDECVFVDSCRGYFKLPNPDYDCAGVKTLFASLRGAAEELETDLKFYTASNGGEQA